MTTTGTINLPILGEPTADFLGQLLEDQQRMTAVQKFSEWHGGHETPVQSRYYQDLIPLTRPKAGQQYAFEVDLDSCTGCKACVAACHSLNGLDETETWRDVGLLVGGPEHDPIMQHVTTACHHCVEPACMDGCPVKAYVKDPVTGIVKHLDDQCIGCQYCVLKCPYDVPKYNKSKGIVRKCDMCSDRLEVGEAPACVQACPNQAIRIKIVDQHRVLEDNEAEIFLPGAPSPTYTHPTTQFKSKRPFPRNTLPADYFSVRREHAHTPLVVMLVLTQLSVGGFVFGKLLEQFGYGFMEGIRPVHAVVSLLLGLLALGASTMHLGRPLYAFRAFIGLRTSWLSREIVAFGLFAKLAAAYALLMWWKPEFVRPSWVSALSWAVAGAGLVGVLCSVMIYHDTRRELWRARRSGARFFLTTAVMGLATTLLTCLIAAGVSQSLTLAEVLNNSAGSVGFMLAGFAGFKLLMEGAQLRHLRAGHFTPMKRTAMLMTGEMRRVTGTRFALGLIGGVLLPLLLAWAELPTPAAAAAIVLAFALTLAGEMLERYLYFTTVVAPKMPGNLH